MLKWYGDKIKSKIERASVQGINVTMSKAAIHAKRNHPGWRNRTGKAEGSIGTYQNARKSGRRIFGIWGSRNVEYFLKLEVKHGACLRKAAGIEYPQLASRIRAAFGGFTA